MKNANFLSLYKAVFIFSIFLIFVLQCSVAAYATADTSRSCEVSVSKAEIKSQFGISGKGNISCDKNSIYPQLGTFEFPGAYAEIYIEIKNTAAQPVRLSNIYAEQPTLEYVELVMPDFSKNEILAPGESCSFSVVVRWNGDSAYSTQNEENGSFGFKLLYESTESEATSDTATDNASIKTGSFNLIISAFAAIAIISFIIYTKTSQNRKRKNNG